MDFPTDGGFVTNRATPSSQKVPGGGRILWRELLVNTADENLAEVEQAEDIQRVETHYKLQWSLYLYISGPPQQSPGPGNIKKIKLKLVL